ncbi:MAG: LysR family transcriptional regulator [Deltaproteobacteria bacterium]|nr:MAG: LysR family transcriptional regulator [Deltaproteobacteria bacterium]
MMQDVSLAQIDTNLLVALDFLLKERSVSRAAERLYVSQPAMSNTLKRLRHLFDDPLLVRVKGGMELTPLAHHIAVPLHQALLHLQAVITKPPTFDPSTAQATFRVAALDYAASVFLPELVEHCAEHAPGIRLTIRPTLPHDCYRALEEGDIDLGIGVFPKPTSNITCELLYQEHFLGLVRDDHPLLDEAITPERYAGYPHGLVSTRGEGEGPVDVALAAAGLHRDITIRVPFFLAVPALLRSSQLVFTLPSQLASWMAQHHNLQTFPPPVKLSPFPIELVWHRRLDQEPGNQWLRDRVRSIAKQTLQPATEPM